MLAPSLLAADFRNLEKEMSWFNQSAASWLHLDVMDGVFVPNISFGFPVLRAVAKLCKKPLDVHLMIVQPEKFIQEVKALAGDLTEVKNSIADNSSLIIYSINGEIVGASILVSEVNVLSNTQ